MLKTNIAFVEKTIQDHTKKYAEIFDLHHQVFHCPNKIFMLAMAYCEFKSDN